MMSDRDCTGVTAAGCASAFADQPRVAARRPRPAIEAVIVVVVIQEVSSGQALCGLVVLLLWVSTLADHLGLADQKSLTRVVKEKEHSWFKGQSRSRMVCGSSVNHESRMWGRGGTLTLEPGCKSQSQSRVRLEFDCASLPILSLDRAQADSQKQS